MKKSILLFVALLSGVQIFADSFLWNVPFGDWSDPANWSCTSFPALPGPLDQVFVPAGTTVNFTGNVAIDLFDLKICFKY